MQTKELSDVFFYFILENKNLAEVLLQNSARTQRGLVLDSIVKEYFNIGVLAENDEQNPNYLETFKNFQYRLRTLNLKIDENWFKEYNKYLLKNMLSIIKETSKYKDVRLTDKKNKQQLIRINGNDKKYPDGEYKKLSWKLKNFYDNTF